LISQYNWTNLYNCLDIESTTELFYSVLNSFFCECVPDSFPLTLDRPPWSTNQLQRLRNLKTNFYKKYKKSGTNFNVLNSHCYSMYLNRCKFEFSKDPREFYNFVNAKRKSSALPSSVRLNSIEASTDPEIADLFAEFFQSTYSSVSWSNSIYPNHLNRENCIFTPVTRRVKGYTRFVGKYVTGRRKRFRPHKVYIFLNKITSQVDLAMSVCPSVCLSVEVTCKSEAIDGLKGLLALNPKEIKLESRRNFSFILGESLP